MIARGMITTDEMRAALQQARIQADAAAQAGNQKLASDWLEAANYWRGRLAAANPMGIPA